MLLPGNLDEGGQKQCWGFVKAATQQQICNGFAFPPEVLQLKPFCSMSCACSGWGGFTGSCKRHIHCMSEPKLFPVVAGPAYTQEKPFPTQSIPRHFEAIVLPIVGLYCWGGLPYASGQVLFAVQDYSVASVLALFDSVLIFFQHMFKTEKSCSPYFSFGFDWLDFPRCFGDSLQEWYGPGTSHGRWILSATFGVARLKVSW